LLTVAGLLFLVLASIKAGRKAREIALPEDWGPLANIFVCITFAWQVDKLGFLQLVRPCPAAVSQVPRHRTLSAQAPSHAFFACRPSAAAPVSAAKLFQAKGSVDAAECPPSGRLCRRRASPPRVPRSRWSARLKAY
jgi:hypothetical protein